MQRKRILLRDFAAVSARVELCHASFLGVLAAVEHEAALGDDGDGGGAQPEVYEVEVVCGFVDEETACVAFVAVPAPEVVGAVACVESPFEVDGVYLADCTFA